MGLEPETPQLPRTAPTAEEREWLDRVAALAPLLTQYRDAGEENRRTPRPVFEAVRDAGFVRMWVSRDLGGEQASVIAGMSALRALAAIDPAVAWQVGVGGAIGHLSDFLPEESARLMFKESHDFVIGGVKPFGKAEIVEGGYVLNGTWSFASGSAHASWLASMAFVTRDGELVMQDDGLDIRVLFIPPEKAQIMDTWHTIGLRGSGSNHYQVSDLFVPEEMTVGKAAMQKAPPNKATRCNGLSYFDFGPFTTAPVGLGIADAAIAAFKRLALSKVPASGASRLAADHVVQDRLARAESAVYSAGVLLNEAARLADAFGETGNEGLSAVIRLAGATAGEAAVAAVDTVYDLAGSSSIFTLDPLDRCFRDVHTATKHIALSWTHFEMIGQYLLGDKLLMRR